MDCPHCGKGFHDTWHFAEVFVDTDTVSVKWISKVTICPACLDATIELSKHRMTSGGGWGMGKVFRVYPNSTSRKPTPTEVPEEIKVDYEEASKVLPLSNKASAALSRRCLQTILRTQGYIQKDLAQQIDALIAEPDPKKSIPTSLRMTVDVIRNFGNFSAHRITDQTTLQIIDVESEEAEWCLDILDEMFDHYYVKPTLAAARKKALDAKLKGAGKPASK
jgi:hypothetical protein